MTNSNGEFRFDPVTPGNANVGAEANGYQEARLGVFINGTNTLNFILQRGGPFTEFGPGRWRVGTDIAPGRYYTDPGDGCYWERLIGNPNAPVVTANETVRYDAAQVIVDILPGDTFFMANTQCGRWFNTPRGGRESRIRPGTFLVGPQVQTGRWETMASSDCFWERLSGFRGDTGDIIESGSADSGRVEVEIRGGDVGFKSSGGCDLWSPVND